MSFLTGEAPSVSSQPTLTPQQQQLLKSLNYSLMNALFTQPGGGQAQTSPGGSVTPTPFQEGTDGFNAFQNPPAASVTPTAPGQPLINFDPFSHQNTGFDSMVGWNPPTGGSSWLDNIMKAMAPDLSGTTLAPGPVYQGDMTAGPSAIQNRLFDAVPRLLSNIGGDKTVNSALDKFLNKYKGGYSAKSFDPTSTLNMFQKSIFDPAMKGYKEETLPQIAELFAGRGSFDSGGTLHTMTESAEDLMGSLMGTKASMLDSAKNAWDQMEMQKFLNINSLIPGMAGAKASNYTSGLAGLPSAMALGDTQQGLGQADINEMVTKWTQGQPYNNPYLNLLNTALGTPAFENVVNGGSTGLLNALAPGVGAGAGAYLMYSLLS